MKGRLDPHARYRELLAARLDRQLSRAENRILLNHLKSCHNCQQAEREYRDQGALLRSLPAPEPPRDMWARTSTALDREVSRWSPTSPRLRRRALARYASSRSGTPNALVTVVAALVVVAGLAVFQYAPTLRTQPQSSPDGSTAVLRPTPFAVNSQALAVVSANETEITVYETDVAQVCPQTAPDCFDDREFVARTVSLPKVRPQNVALRPGGGELAVVGHNQDEDVIAVVMLRSGKPASAARKVTRRRRRSPNRRMRRASNRQTLRPRLRSPTSRASPSSPATEPNRPTSRSSRPRKQLCQSRRSRRQRLQQSRRHNRCRQLVPRHRRRQAPFPA